MAVVSDDPDRAFAAFAAEFTPVEAAGGVVVNDCGEWLMIHRNGRWDLPKGHLECGERIEECAAREVEEETGVAARVVRPLCETLHAYYFPKTARWELKRTHWYELHASGCAGLTPQTEEGIDSAVWCAPREVGRQSARRFPDDPLRGGGYGPKLGVCGLLCELSGARPPGICAKSRWSFRRSPRVPGSSGRCAPC